MGVLPSAVHLVSLSAGGHRYPFQMGSAALLVEIKQVSCLLSIPDDQRLLDDLRSYFLVGRLPRERM